MVFFAVRGAVAWYGVEHFLFGLLLPGCADVTGLLGDGTELRFIRGVRCVVVDHRRFGFVPFIQQVVL